MTHGDVEKWKVEVEKVKETDVLLKAPVDVIVGEAVEVAKFVERYWEPSNDRPGLKDAGKRIARRIVSDG